MLSNGELLTQLVAKGFEGEIGPFGGEDPIVNGNELILYSQMPECGYRFKNNGSVEVFFPDKEAMYRSLVGDCEYTEEEAKAIVDDPDKYDSVLDLLNNGEDGWFYYFTTNHPVLYKAIKEFVEFIKGDLEDD